MQELIMGCDHPDGKCLSVFGESHSLAEDRTWTKTIAGTEFVIEYRALRRIVKIRQADGGDIDALELDAIAEAVRFVPV